MEESDTILIEKEVEESGGIPGLRLTFFANDQILTSLLEGTGKSDSNCSIVACMKVMDKPLIVHSIDALNRALKGKITEVAIPKQFKGAQDIVQQRYRNLNIREVDNVQSRPTNSYSSIVDWSNRSILLPINSIVHSFSAAASDIIPNNWNVQLDLIKYPWNFLAATQRLLRDNLTTTYISPSAKISKTSVIEGPCVIEDNVVLDDFCKIKGPAYISEGSFIGMSSLVRSSILGKNTKIGFNCEIAKSFFCGNTKISHQNEILDSIIGSNVWFGGYSATANVLLTKENVKFQSNGRLLDTGTYQFGAVVGNNSAVGAHALILPGRQIPPNSKIQAGTIVRK
jgi:acetyltransferase-like isoleucine patch superfamily enzyme